jgi:hypothetical protein
VSNRDFGTGQFADINTAVTSDTIRMVILAEFTVGGITTRVNSSNIPLTIAAVEFTGVGNFGSIDRIEEGAGIQMYGIRLGLSGIPLSDGVGGSLAVLLTNDYQGAPITISLVMLDENHELIQIAAADMVPVVMFVGTIDTIEIEFGQSAAITLTAESNLLDWQRPRVRRYNGNDQEQRFTGDLGLEFVERTTDIELFWGRT